jgi:serine/threonine protein kinase/Tol biopolymer transport system component
MPLAAGTRFGSYEILSALGAGGMGEVYRARDTRLDRDVAIKILPEAFAADADRVARFQREAKVLASLNHPHIAAIYGLEEANGIRALVLELIEGPTLADRIARGPIPLDEAVVIARQIADALEAAHEQGIVHRDLKPANVKVRDDGTVKVLDFGLAKTSAGDAAGSTSGSAALTNSPTLDSPGMTGIGVVLGTAAYMAPEQAKGRVADKRADVWSFGAVLYEMLTGRRCFQGDDLSDTFAAILRADPNWTALPPGTPIAIRRLLRRSLDKDVRSRLSDMAMVRVELRDAETDPREDAASGVRPSRSSTLRRVAPYAAVVVAALVTGLAVWRVRQPAEVRRPLARFSIDLPDQMQLSAPDPVAISPDGTHLVYVANQRLYLRKLDQLDAAPIAGADSGGLGAPFFSPDGQWIAFWQDRQLRKVALSGGAPMTICEAVNPAPVGATWEPDGNILWGAGPNGVMRVPATGGTAESLISLKDGTRASNPQTLPGGEWVLFVLHATASTLVGDGKVVVQSRATRERRVLIDGVRVATYIPSGHIVFGRGNALLAQAFDPARLTLSGGPVAMLDGVANAVNQPAMYFAISSTGTLLYVPGSTAGATALTNLVQVARDGARSSLAEVAGLAWFPRFSPDGSRVAYGVSAGPDLERPSDLWVLDVARGSRTRVTFTGNNRFHPIWTRDGTRLTFADGIGATNRLLWTLADGSGGLLTLMDADARRFPTSWSRDGRTLAFYVGGVNSSRDVWMLHRDGDQWTPTPFVETPFEERGAIFSPDGRWVAYVSNKSGQNHIYARPYPGPGGEVTISMGGGQEPVWAPSGRELFYRHGGRLLAVQIDQAASSLTVGAPARVFDDPYRLDTAGTQGGVANYDISADGLRFVMVEEPRPTGGGTQAVRLQVILNWHEELKRLVPTR